MRRIRLSGFATLTCVAFAAVLLGPTLPASALTKVRSSLPIATVPFVVEGFCPFAITDQDIHGSATQTLVFDAAGNLVRIDLHFHGVITQLSANGKTLTFNDSGPVSVFPQDDGSDVVFLRGNTFEADQGLITGEPMFILSSGAVVLISVFNPETGYNDFSSISTTGQTTDVCEALAA